MLVNVWFFILTFAGGALSDYEPPGHDPSEPSCPKDEHYTRNNPRCIRTCANKWVPISDDCKPFTGCVCNGVLVRFNDDGSGSCVSEDKCPCRDDPKNAGDRVYTAHAEALAYAEAAQEETISDCDGKSIIHSSSKSSSLSKSSSSYTSVVSSNCGGKKCSDPNAVYKDRPNACPLTCAHPNPRPCNKMPINKGGCECAQRFVLNEDTGRCVRPKDCPKPIRCPKNSHYVINDNKCPKTCGNRVLPYSDVAGACVPFTGCACKPGFVSKYDNATIPCIRESSCPPIPTQCGVNEVPTSCAIDCPPQTCESIFSKYYCLPTECKPGCDCQNGFLRNKNGVCIPSEDCFKPDPIECGLNEVYSDCAITCPPQSCESLFVEYLCAEPICAPGCNCIDGYLRNSLGNCVPSEECYNDPGGCNGDLNATRVRGCGSNRPTCENPEPEANDNICVLNGCECKPGYILSSDDGNCIFTRDCPGGSPKCGANQTYTGCKFDCRNNFCPTDDSRAQLYCALPYPCQGGCACKADYLMLSFEDRRCVSASDCPEVECKRSNEKWDPDPSVCFLERCEDRDSRYCNYPNPSGPRCVCNEGFYRNGSDICIPVSECPPRSCNGDFNATLTKCPNNCPKTCDDPYAGDDGCIEICGATDCQCNPGYFLTKLDGGICIKPEDCESCNGDSKAKYSYCPSACEPTCANRDLNQVCTKQCMPPGCVCRDGYVLNQETGKCIKPESCPSGCGEDSNAMYSPCPTACEPTCDNPDPQICTYQCLPPGCVCKPGFVKSKDGKCVKPETCPALGCEGDRNATYNECPSYCPMTCDDQDPNKPCIAACAPSGCVCNPGYVLTAKGDGGKCILPKDCPVVDKGCNGDLNATHSECPSSCPPTCENRNSKEKVLCPTVCDPSGCVCKQGFILTKKGGKCVKPEDCPVPVCKDPKKVYKKCPSACEPTCSNPDPNQVCTKQCMPPGCVCKKGFVLNEETGKCVERENCPADSGCKGDMNATYSDCTSVCPTTCSDRFGGGPIMYCPAVCGPPGCVCKPEYILTEKGGLCILPEDCPELGCGGDKNAVLSDCPSACEPTCANPKPEICTLQCLPPGCVCKPGFVKSDDGTCIKPETCPEIGCGGDLNAMHSECPNDCVQTCKNLYPTCTGECRPPGCVCKPGFVLESGKCITPESCPAEPQCKGDRNATYKENPSNCQATCEYPNPGGQCMDKPPSCVCKHGYLLREKGGPCIYPEDCPGGWPTCRANETYLFCKEICPNDYCPVDDSRPGSVACDPSYPCPGGCVCKEGYLIAGEDDDRCILSSDCEPVECTRPYEIYDRYAPGCLHERCDDKHIPCDFQYPGPPRCRCIEGYYRNQDDICVPEYQCPKPGCNGDLNATFSECPSKCPPTCCAPDRTCDADCDSPGCVCNYGYILSKPGGPCISPYDCDGGSPHCGENMTYTSCEIDCLMKYCPQDEHEIFVICDPVWPCPSGCECKPGYLMTNTGNKTCILAKDCPPVECTGDYEEWDPTPSSCNYERCDEMYYTCDDPTPGRPKCVCKEGYYRNDDGVCIPAEECPKPGCNGDLNATFSECPSKCPPTCCAPDRTCDGDCDCPGCVCNYGYILAKPGGPCISPYDCDGGSPHCGENMTYTSCEIDCLMKYCPQDEHEIFVICDPVWPCPSGCECKPGYLMTNTGNKTCIMAKDCPPVECTGDYEEWDPTPSSCNYERCDEMYYTCDDPTPGRPKCVCKEGYYRNDDGVCIPAEECPKPEPVCGYNEVAVPCRQICPPQNCEIAYTDYACTDESKICEPGCDCLPDHLRNGSGICIPNDQCPYPSTPVCGINEIARDCKRICPPQTCQSKYIMYNCIQDLPCEPGCDCVANYLRDERGICIPSEKCPPEPKPEPVCGYNEVAVPCRQICPPQNCEIAYTEYACTEESKICEPGCDCLPDHLRNGSGICIPNDQCPYPSTPVCGINEIARDCRRICPPQTCLSKYALFRCVEDLPCEPGCDCVPNYLRDERGICIHSEQCPAPCQVPDECMRTCKEPNPKGCVYNPPKNNMKGCDCKEGYILSELGGDCILIDQCPPEIACHGDSNARPKRCPKPCPSTCQSPNQFPCKRMCEAIACECKSGFLLSNNTESARCILPEKCPGGNPCGEGGRFVDCKSDCKRDYCPVDDSRDPVYCDASENDCLSGCICDLNHKKKSLEDPTCIVSSNCTPVNCTRRNEEWSSCPLACLFENCEDMNNQPTVCNTLVLNCEPRCICKKDHFRNSSGICVPAEDCPPPGCGGDSRAVFSDCPSACEPTCDNPDPQICTDQCMPPGCVCMEGFVLNEETGKCVERENCPVPDCKDPNAVYKKCTSACEPTCANRDPQGCTEQCMPPGCVCKEGFVLNEETGECVEPCNCPDC